MGNNRPLMAIIKRDCRYPSGNLRMTVLRQMNWLEYAGYRLRRWLAGRTVKSDVTTGDFIALSVGVTIDKEQYNALLGNQSQNNPILHASGRIAMTVLPPKSALQSSHDESYSP